MSVFGRLPIGSASEPDCAICDETVVDGQGVVIDGQDVHRECARALQSASRAVRRGERR